MTIKLRISLQTLAQVAAAQCYWANRTLLQMARHNRWAMLNDTINYTAISPYTLAYAAIIYASHGNRVAAEICIRGVNAYIYARNAKAC